MNLLESLGPERLYTVKLAVMAGFKFMASHWVGLSWLLGPWGRLLAIPFEIFVSGLVLWGVIELDAKLIAKRVKFEEKELSEGQRRMMKAIKGRTLSEQEKQVHRDEIMRLAARFASYHRLR